MTDNPDYYIDITEELCPLTFVKTKLAVEKMRAGEIIEVRLQGAEPLRNVPRSARELGHLILSLLPEPGQSTVGIHRLFIKKS